MEQRNDKIWIFNAGNTFTGNPKWMFIYVNKFRKDIKAYWLSDSKEVVREVRKLGYRAYTYQSKRAKKIEDKTGVFVVEMVKEHIPEHMKDVKILNLWHGVGCKSIERGGTDFGFLNNRIAKKYIKYNSVYRDNQMFLVTSPLMEKHFKEQCGIDDDKVIRGGYPRCMYNMYKERIATYDHDILKQKGLPENAKIAIYAPTYRDGSQKEMFGKAIPDMEKLIKKLKEKNMLLIFKMHPLMEGDYNYIQLKEFYKDCPNLMFWDNSKDIYEIFYKIDLGIIDYSSIFYDMLASGVPNFIRYFFDYDDKDNLRDFVFDVEEMTCGKICNDFEDLVSTLGNYEKQQNKKELERIYDLFWKYTNENSFEDIIKKIIEFKPESRELPQLHSYDIFDTLIGRKTFLPEGIFYYVKAKMEQSDLKFPSYLISNYISVRMKCESNVREFYNKSVNLRNSDKIEITFKEIFDRMADLYYLTEEQVDNLMKWELEAEYENSIPYPEKINELKENIQAGNKVILISDMYLPKDFIQKLLEKADPILAELPLFLSSEYGVQKTTNKLFLEAYHSLEYNYSEWIHHGDNPNADGKMPRKLAIKTDIHKIKPFNSYEKAVINNLRTYDSYLVAKLMRDFRIEHEQEKDCYAYSYVSLYWVPYVSYVIRDAVKRGIECLYFISRDGYHLKRIADKIIEMKNISIKTKYIYGSRKAWRIPSFIDKIDDEFWGGFGNLAGANNINDLLQGLDIKDEKTFVEIFPELERYTKQKNITNEEKKQLISIFKYSKKYEEYLLKKAEEERVIVDKYLKQEINFKEKFAFAEYWGRGYTQDCLARLIQNITKEETEVPFYYLRSIYPTIGTSVRYNFTQNTGSVVFIETIFANLPYESVEGYQYNCDGKLEPIMQKRKNDQYLHGALKKYLIQFCENFYKLNLLDEERIERSLFDFSLKWFYENPKDRFISESIGDLKDSVVLYSEERSFARKFTKKDIISKFKNKGLEKESRYLKMSLARSEPSVRKLYDKKVAKAIKAEQRKKKMKEFSLLKFIKKCLERLTKFIKKKKKKIKKKIKKTIEKIKRKVNSILMIILNGIFRRIYKIENDKVVFLSDVRDVLGGNLEFIYNRVPDKKYKKVLYLKPDRKVRRSRREKIKLLKDLARSKYIILDDFSISISHLKPRKEQEIVQLWHGPGAFKTFGYSRLDKKNAKNKYYLHRNYTKAIVTSEQIKWCYAEGLGMDEKNVYATGFPRTDTFFNKEYIRKTREEIYAEHPFLRNKKVIVFAPTYRGKNLKVANYDFEQLDLDKIYEELKDEYVFIFKWHPAIYNNLESGKLNFDFSKYEDFYYDFSNYRDINDILLITDVLITDYSSVVFDYLLVNKPIVYFTYDLEEYQQERGLYYPFEDYIYGDVALNSEELIEAIRNENMETEKREKFNEKFMKACDGNSTERVYKLIFGEK